MEGNAMRGIVLFILASWWVGVVTGKFGEQQSIVLSKDPEYAIEDFLIVGEVLLVANSYTTGAQLFVIDVSSSNMTILTSTTICTVSKTFLALCQKSTHIPSARILINQQTEQTLLFFHFSENE
jgi:hypothetical protein